MKGILPWIREALFGPAKPKCQTSYCHDLPHAECNYNHCALHCRLNCDCREFYALTRIAKKRRSKRKDFNWPEELDV